MFLDPYLEMMTEMLEMQKELDKMNRNLRQASGTSFAFRFLFLSSILFFFVVLSFVFHSLFRANNLSLVWTKIEYRK